MKAKGVTFVVLAIAGGLIFWVIMSSTGPGTGSVEENVVATSNEFGQVSDQAFRTNQTAQPRMTDQVAPSALNPHSGAIPAQPAQSAKREEVSLSELVKKLNKNPEIARWKKEGATDGDLELAAKRMRSQGFPDDHILDLNLLSPYMPLRNIEPVYFSAISIPEKVAAGSPISFSAEANFPDPSFSFERWDVTQEGDIVTFRPVGSRSGANAPSVIVPITLEHEMNPLDPGEYTFRFTGLGEVVEKTVIVD